MTDEERIADVQDELVSYLEKHGPTYLGVLAQELFPERYCSECGSLVGKNPRTILKTAARRTDRFYTDVGFRWAVRDAE